MVTGIVSSVVGWQLLFLFFGLSPAFPARACFCLLHRRLQRVSTQGGVVNQRASCVWSLNRQSVSHTGGEDFHGCSHAPQASRCVNVHRSIVHSLQKVATTRVSIVDG